MCSCRRSNNEIPHKYPVQFLPINKSTIPFSSHPTVSFTLLSRFVIVQDVVGPTISFDGHLVIDKDTPIKNAVLMQGVLQI